MPRAIRPIRIEGDIAYVPLTQGYTAVIDAADVALVADFNWRAMIRRRPDGSIRAVYAVRSNKTGNGPVNVRMHQLLSGARKGMETDHRDTDGLNNRRSNLRLATFSENKCNQRRQISNTSGVKGVCWHKGKSKWQAQIDLNGKRRHLGRFASLEAAAAAYAKASAELHGEFGRTDSIFFARDWENTQSVPHG